MKASRALVLPDKVSELRRYMGKLNFCRHMTPSFAEISFPLTEMLRVNQSSKDTEWDDEAKVSFNILKQAIGSCPTLSFPNPDVSENHSVTNRSSYANGGASYQMSRGQTLPIAFYSKKLLFNERIISTFDRELLATFTFVVKFRHLTDGNKG